MRRFCTTAICSAVCVMVGTMANVAWGQETNWQAGLARARITPMKPIHLAGYAQRNRPFDTVDADLYVKALALDDGQGHRAVLMTSDLIGFRAAVAEELCQQIEQRTGLQRDQILLNSSHTHTGPDVSLEVSNRSENATEEDARATVEYTRWMIEQAAQAAEKAIADLKPARLRCGTGVAKFVMNRREHTPTGVRLGVNPRGLADRSVPVLRIDSPEGELRAVVFGAACHNTTLTGNHYGVSGDYAGFAQEYVEQQVPQAQAMFLAGCGGSSNPYPRGTLEIAKMHGRELGEEVCRVLNERSQLRPINGPLTATNEPVDLPLQGVSREEIDRLLSQGRGWEPWAAQRMLKVLERGESLPEHYRTSVAVWQFGDDLTLVGFPGEVVVDYVPLIEKAVGPLNLWMSAYCNDVFGYVPSAEILSEGGYETRGLYHGGIGFFAPEVESVLVAKVRQLAERAGRTVPPQKTE